MISLTKGGLTVIIELTDRCQLDCSYCISPRQDRDTSDADVVAMIRGIAQLVPHTRPLSFVWHGGEPLFRGTEYFRWIEQVQRDTLGPERAYSNTVQTNGLLITDSMIEFMKQSCDFSPMVSMDGPDAVTSVTRGIEVDYYDALFARLRKEEIPFSVSTVGTQVLLEHREAAVDYFRRQKVFGVAIIPLMTGVDSTAPLPSPDLMADIALKTKPNCEEGAPEVTLLGRNLVSSIMNQLWWGGASLSSFTQGCHRHVICLAPDGQLYTCPRGRCVGLWSYGHIQEGGLENWWSSTEGPAPFRASLPTECAGCKWVENCHGGCPANALSMNGGPEKKDRYCSSFKTLFEYAEHNWWRDYHWFNLAFGQQWPGSLHRKNRAG